MMKREIKYSFLLQNEETGLMFEKIYTFDCILSGAAIFEMNMIGRSFIIARREFVGHKDKNGKDLFEGDIISNPQKQIGEIVFYEAGFHLKAKRHNGDVWYIPINSGMLKNKEKVGNIYENPDLIK